ncbi:MAG: sigma-54 dependent transcriptional regulator [Bacteroidota bacterium]
MAKVLIIDDEDKIRSLLSRIIELEGFDVHQASTCKAGLKKIEIINFDVVLCDVKLPDGNGVDLVKEIKSLNSTTEVILLTAYGNIPDGVQAIKNGAFDYITKGNDNNKIIPLLNRAMDKIHLTQRVNLLEKQVEDRYSFKSVFGKSKAIITVVELAKKVAPTDTTVLLLGETGTGKEIFAQAIHQESLRCKKSFVAINCSAFSKELIESEMFGHIAGAFTGAIKSKKGLFEEANLGTIFLDEIGELSIDLQAKLLRVLETGEFIKIGESSPTKTNIRIIAATNRNLEKEVENGNFRRDLFYRLSVFQISLPALRERSEDIPILVNYFVELFAAKSNKKLNPPSTYFMEIMKKHLWQGNIRELKNIVERCVILSNNGVLSEEALPIDFNTPNINESESFTMADVEKNHIQKILKYTQGNKMETARLLNIGTSTLYRKIEEYKIG